MSFKSEQAAACLFRLKSKFRPTGDQPEAIEALYEGLRRGEQRLVLLARAFVKEPSLLILDEPLHGLDDENRKMVKTLVDNYCQDPSKTLIYVTHYQEELPACIDHSIFLERH